MAVTATAKLNRDSRDGSGITDVDTERVRRAIHMAVRVLSERPDGEDVRHLLEQAEDLLTLTEGWGAAPPSPEVRDQVVRSVMSIHLSALRASRGQ
jgi:hypothetical protein